MAVDLIYRHQQKTYNLMKESIRTNKRAAYEFPTGCGKTFPALKYIDESPEKSVLVIVPSTTIKAQWERYVRNYIDNGAKRIRDKNIAVITYQKIALLFKKVQNLKLNTIIVDEVHRMGAATWEPAIDELIESDPDIEVIAMTATPKRTDKRNMIKEKFGENVVYEMSLLEALSGEKEGEVILKNPRYIRVLSELIPHAREYKEKISQVSDGEKREKLLKKYERLEAIISTSPAIQDVLAQGMQNQNGKYIVFCKNRDDMKEKMEQAQDMFQKVNLKINMEYLLSKRDTNDKFGKSESQNKKTLERFENSQSSDSLQLLFCVDKLNEGIHLEGIDGIILFDSTNSQVLYKQRIGRATTPNRETVIIDAVNNWLTQIDTYMQIEMAIKKGIENRLDNSDDNLFKLLPEELELLTLFREIGEELENDDRNVYQEIIDWLENHKGKLPRYNIFKNGKLCRRNEITKEEQEEVNLRGRWINSDIKKVMLQFAGKPIEEVPEEYREKIQELRDYGYGSEVKNIFEEVIDWLDAHERIMPRFYILGENSKKLKVNEMSKEEQEEVNLRARWQYSEEYKILTEYAGKPIEEVPEEYQEKIQILRDYGLGLKEKTVYEQIIEWLEKHDGKMPSGTIRKDGKLLKVDDMLDEERAEINLYARWCYSEERKILMKYIGKPIEEVPEEYREKIQVLRNYGYGLKEETTYEQIINWLETHEEKMPRRGITDGTRRRLKSDEMTEEEKYEINLYGRWYRSKEKQILNEYAGRDIEEVPEEYREKIAKLRSLGQMGTRQDEQIKKIMKKSVSQKVEENAETRAEMHSTKLIDSNSLI